MTVVEAKELDRLVHAHSLWLPQGLASGHYRRPASDETDAEMVEDTLHPLTVLKAAAGISHRNNSTRRMVWRSAAIGQRVGSTSAKNGSDVLRALKYAGVIKDYHRKGTGSPYTVEFNTYVAFFKVPQGVLWEYKWFDGNITGPRYGKDTALVLRWILAVLAASDFGDGIRITHDKGAAHIVAVSGLEKSAYDRAWAAVRKCVADPDMDTSWLIWETQAWEDGGGTAPNVFTLDWSKVPAPKTPEVTTRPVTKKTRHHARRVSLIKATTPPTEVVSEVATEVVPEVGGEALSTPTPTPEVREPSKEASSSTTAISNQCSSPSSAARPDAKARTSKAEVTKKTEAMVDDLRLTDVIDRGLWSDHVETDQAVNTNTDYDTWLLVLVALLVDAKTPNRVGISRHDYRALRNSVRDWFDKGWIAKNFALALTVMSPPHSFAAALPTRLAQVSEEVNFVAVATSAKEQEERAAYERLNSYRYASTYTQKTL